jgi:hypothetical protein
MREPPYKIYRIKGIKKGIRVDLGQSDKTNKAGWDPSLLG